MARDWEQIVRGMASAVDEVRLAAARALEEALKEALDSGMAEWEPVVACTLPALLRGIGDRHKGVQVHSANALQFLAYQSGEVIPALRATLAEPSDWQAWGAAIVLSRMGLWSRELGEALAAAMGATDRDVRWAAAGHALQLGRNHPDAVDVVRRTLAGGSALARKMAAYCLGAMGGYTDVGEALAAQLSDPERDVRRAVILAIARLPRVAEPTRAQVAALTADPDPFVRRAAAAVVAKLERL